jgi:hypothetical protein
MLDIRNPGERVFTGKVLSPDRELGKAASIAAGEGSLSPPGG